MKSCSLPCILPPSSLHATLTPLLLLEAKHILAFFLSFFLFHRLITAYENPKCTCGFATVKSSYCRLTVFKNPLKRAQTHCCQDECNPSIQTAPPTWLHNTTTHSWDGIKTSLVLSLINIEIFFCPYVFSKPTGPT